MGDQARTKAVAVMMLQKLLRKGYYYRICKTQMVLCAFSFRHYGNPVREVACALRCEVREFESLV